MNSPREIMAKALSVVHPEDAYNDEEYFLEKSDAAIKALLEQQLVIVPTQFVDFDGALNWQLNRLADVINGEVA